MLGKMPGRYELIDTLVISWFLEFLEDFSYHLS